MMRPTRTDSLPFCASESVNYLAVNGGLTEPLDFIKNILICVPKMNAGLTGVEQHEGESLMTEFSFLGKLTLYVNRIRLV